MLYEAHQADLTIFEIVADALQPFKARQITIEVVDTIDTRAILVTVDILPNHPIKVYPQWHEIMKAPQLSAELVGIQVAEAIKDICVPVDDHIHLGEE